MLIIGTLVFLSFSVIIIAAIGLSRNRLIKVQKEKLIVVKASEKKYRNLVESINDGVFVVDNQGVLLFVNTELVKLLGIPLDKIINQPLQEIFQGENVKSLLLCIEQTFKSEKVEKVEFDLTIGKNLYWFETILIPQHKAEISSFNVLGISRDITERKVLENKQRELVATLKNQQDTLKLLSKEVIRAQEEERARISRDIHDEIGQALTALTFNLELLKNPENQKEEIEKRIEDCKRLVETTIEDVRRFSYELRPTILDDLGLLPAFQSHAREYKERTGIEIQINVIRDIDEINDELKTVLYRIFQESLNNIAKHAHASRVIIDLTHQGNKLNFKIQDNGVGFNTDAVLNRGIDAGGLGIKGIRERVELIGGKLNLKSKPNKGTELWVSIPYGEA
ncbi:MAG: PAS domain S-box protein [Planctomycetia bacterium]|nr:PAS domain S-box protein [Planctomycetia bacterium]